MKRKLIVAIGLVIVIVTFAFVLPKVADYREVWALVKTLTWGWAVALAGVTVLNLATFAPPWQVALPGLRFVPALTVTQASTALSIVVPGGAAVGMAGSYGMLRGLGFEGRAVGRAVTLTGIWNQFANLAYPIVAAFLISITGGDTAVLATVAFVGVAILGIAVAGLALVLASRSLAEDLGDAAAATTSWVLAKVRRGPVAWRGASFVRFRDETNELLARRWHLLTLATLAGSLTVFLVLLVSLRAFGIDSGQVTVIEAFAAWALARLLGSIPITPGGIGIVELSLTSTLIGFGGANAGVVAATLVFRFLTIVPTLLLGLAAVFVWRRRARLPA